MDTHLTSLVTFRWSTPGYRSTFTADHVNILFRSWRRHSTVPFNAYCVTDDPEGLDEDVTPVAIWENPVPAYGGGNAPNCFRRLRMFSDEVSEAFGPRWIWTDLDCVVTGNVDDILSTDADLKIWRPTGDVSRCNGSLVAYRSGSRPEIWNDFTKTTVGTVEEFRAQTGHLGSDQAWMSLYIRPDDQFFGESDGVYAFRKLRNPVLERHMAKQEKVAARGKEPRGASYTRDAAGRRERMDQRRERREKERLSTPLPSNCKLAYFPGSVHPWDRNLQKLYSWIGANWR
jgi:hypothetical protein